MLTQQTEQTNEQEELNVNNKFPKALSNSEMHLQLCSVSDPFIRSGEQLSVVWCQSQTYGLLAPSHRWGEFTGTYATLLSITAASFKGDKINFN